MKSLTAVFLAGSLVINAVLVYAAVAGRARLDGAAAQEAQLPARHPGSVVSGPAPVDPATWSKLETADLPVLVTRLRDAGFPKEVIRAMLNGLLTEKFAARRRALDPEATNRPFWKDRAPDQKLQLAQFQLMREQEQVLRTLLGPDARSSDPLALARQRAMFGNLPPDKMEAAQLILDDFNQKRTELYFTKGSTTMDEHSQIEREQRAALAAVLSPAELEEYDLRSSNTGRNLRRELAAFNPTEEEFRALYKLRQPFDEKYNFSERGIPSQEVMRQRNEAQKQLTADVKALLGPARATEYERSTDYNYQRTAQLVARLNLPSETTMNLWNTQKEFEQRRNDIYRNGVSLAPAVRTQQLTALQQEAEARITPLLGGDANRFEAYKQYGGQWIQNLLPRPRPSP